MSLNVNGKRNICRPALISWSTKTLAATLEEMATKVRHITWLNGCGGQGGSSVRFGGGERQEEEKTVEKVIKLVDGCILFLEICEHFHLHNFEDWMDTGWDLSLKFFARGVNFSKNTHFFVFLSLKMLKFNEIKGVKSLIWKSGGVRFLTNLMSGWISSSLLCIYFFSLTHHMTMFKWRVCGPYCEDALGIVSIGRLFPLYIHTDYLILNTSTSMLIPWHIFENICCVSLESCLWAFSMLSELIPKVSDSWACTMYFKDIHAMQHLHIQNKHIYSESALVDVSVIWFTLWNTQIKQLWPDYGLLTLCPLWRFTSEVDFFKFSHLHFNFQFLQGFTSFGRNFNFQFLSITMEHQNHLRQRSNLDQDQRQNLQQEQDRRRGQVANLSVEMGNDDSHFSPLSNTTKGETFWTHN